MATTQSNPRTPVLIGGTLFTSIDSAYLERSMKCLRLPDCPWTGSWTGQSASGLRSRPRFTRTAQKEPRARRHSHRRSLIS